MNRLAHVLVVVPLALAFTPQATDDLLRRCETAQPVRRILLPGALREISGLAVTSAGELLAHNDARGRVFALDSASGRVLRRYELQGDIRQDFEGIAVARDTVFLMTSTGLVYLFRDGADGDSVPFQVFDTGLGRVCELEGLAWDPADRVLLLPCKVQRGAGMRSGLLVFRWSPDRRSAATPAALEVPAAVLRRTLRVSTLRPTAVEVDTASGRILVLSASPQALVEMDRTGRLLVAVGLRSTRHPQPEALALLPGSLVVGDEGGEGRGMLTVYACKS
jgi:uncharacterized protein YjiK